MRNVIKLFVITLTLSLGLFVFSGNAAVPTPGCSIVIENQTIPESAVDFPFTISGEINDEFVLQDTDEEFFFIPTDSAVTVTEQVLPGWVLRDIACEIIEGSGVSVETVSNGIQFTCNEQVEVTNVDCAFINTQAEAIPTVSQWGVIALVLGLGVVGYLVIRRRSVTA